MAQQLAQLFAAIRLLPLPSANLTRPLQPLHAALNASVIGRDVPRNGEMKGKETECAATGRVD